MSGEGDGRAAGAGAAAGPEAQSGDGGLLGVVLAGGGSRRFGRPKALEPVGGRPMAAWAVRALEPHVARVGVAGAVEVGARLGVEARPDLRPGRGPLEGLRTALAWAEEEGRDGVVVLACDLPLVPPALVGVLAEAGPGPAVVPASPGPLGVEPLCARYGVDARGAVTEALDAGLRAAHRLLERLEARVIPLDEVAAVADPTTAFLNVNTPEAAERAGALLARGAPSRASPCLPPAVCVVGKKNSGKTAVTVALVEELSRRGHRVMTVKHGHAFDLDVAGTDSWRHRHEGGAERVLMAGPEEVAMVGGWGREGELGVEALIRRFLPDAGVVVVEGYKHSALPRIEVYRRAAHAAPIYEAGAPEAERWLAVVTDAPDFEAPVAVHALDQPDLAGRLADLVETRVMEGEP